LLGVLARCGCGTWCFCGEFVVECVVERGELTVTFRVTRMWQVFRIYFPGKLEDAAVPGRCPMHPMESEVAMRTILAKGAVAGLGLVMMLGVGCKRKPAPVQPVVRAVPRVRQTEPVFPPLPDQDEDLNAAQGTGRAVRRARVAPMPVQPGPVVDAGAAEAAQRRQDARLLQQQQAASQRQQKEVDGIVQQSVKASRQMQDEPRIQDTPPGPASIEAAPAPQGIQDAPGPAQTQPQTVRPGQEAPSSIQDAPGPVQPQPQAQPQAQAAPQEN
jgi:hypothetical protein